VARRRLNLKCANLVNHAVPDVGTNHAARAKGNGVRAEQPLQGAGLAKAVVATETVVSRVANNAPSSNEAIVLPASAVNAPLVRTMAANGTGTIVHLNSARNVRVPIVHNRNELPTRDSPITPR
jgi:hypothetical protein